MKPRKSIDECILYDDFDNPYTAIAAMILFQAVDDLVFLRGRDSCRRAGSHITRYDIIKFLKSDWAEELASPFGLGRDVLLKVAREA